MIKVYIYFSQSVKYILIPLKYFSQSDVFMKSLYQCVCLIFIIVYTSVILFIYNFSCLSNQPDMFEKPITTTLFSIAVTVIHTTTRLYYLY